MIGFVVERIGLQALVQDAGRFGLRAVGVPTGGPADPVAHEQGNALLGQEPLAGLEVLVGGVALRAVRPVVVAVTGAPCDVTVDGAPAPFGEPVALTTGQVVDVGAVGAGLRTYVAVAGGLDVEPVLGSRASDPRNDLGPAPLAVGDTLDVGEATGAVVHGVACPPTVGRSGTVVVPATWGPRADWFTPASRETFAVAEWEVTGDADRVGTRLAGPVLERTSQRELRSEGVVPGSVQVPGSGQPIVFGPDSPTTGGYPVIAVVDHAALGLIGQAAPGSRLRFDLRKLPGNWD